MCHDIFRKMRREWQRGDTEKERKNNMWRSVRGNVEMIGRKRRAKKVQ